MMSAGVFNLAGLFAFSLVLTLTSTEPCSPQARPAYEKIARFGEAVTMKAEYRGVSPFLISWTREITDPTTAISREQRLVTYINGTNTWNDKEGPRMYAVFYRLENAIFSYELQILNATCESEGLYTADFWTNTNQDCAAIFNVSIVADPMAPLLRNETIYANPGSTVDVLCEANVGNPAGDIWWYYVPADGSSSRRITTGVTSNTSIAGDCRGNMTSTLRIAVNNEDQNAKILCKTINPDGQGRFDNVAEGRIAVFGLEPGVHECRGYFCSVQSGTSGLGHTILSITTLAHVFVLFIPIVVL